MTTNEIARSLSDAATYGHALFTGKPLTEGECRFLAAEVVPWLYKVADEEGEALRKYRTLRAEEDVVRERNALKAALSGLMAHEVYTYEGGLEATITVPKDAIDTARNALRGTSGGTVLPPNIENAIQALALRAFDEGVAYRNDGCVVDLHAQRATADAAAVLRAAIAAKV